MILIGHLDNLEFCMFCRVANSKNVVPKIDVHIILFRHAVVTVVCPCCRLLRAVVDGVCAASQIRRHGELNEGLMIFSHGYVIKNFADGKN